MSYKVSVIIPIFNAENFLKVSIDSLINQTLGFENIEVILIDDCSTDNSKELILSLSKKYSNIKPLFSKVNDGSPSNARNMGIYESSASYIMFLDSDDVYYPEMCEVMYDTIEKFESDVVCCRYNFIKNSKEKIAPSFLGDIAKDIVTINSIENFPDFLSMGCPTMVWNKIYKKSVIINNNVYFPLGIFYEDVYFTSKFFLSSKNIIFLNDFIGYGYKIRDNENKSISQDFNKNLLIKQLNGFKKVMNLFNHEKYYFLYNELIVDMSKIYLYSNLDNNCQKKFLKVMKPYYKDYKFNSKLHTAILPFNILINIFIKLFSISTKFTILVSNLYTKF